MAKSKVKKVIKFLHAKLKDKSLNISKIVLFGSRAKGKAGRESDIDIVIVSEHFRK